MEREQLRQLYMQHGPELRQAMARLAPEIDAHDLLQELFALLLVDSSKLRKAASPRAWLFGMAVKLASTRRRSMRLRRFLGLEHARSFTDVHAPDATTEQRDAERVVQEALSSVSMVRREAFVLFELQGLSGEEISTALGIPLKTVWTRLFHARREVNAALERHRLREARTTGLSIEEIRP